MSMLYLLANLTLALSMKPGLQIVTTVQIHNPETFIGWNAKERCEEARKDRLGNSRHSKYGQQEIISTCIGS